MLTWSAIFGSIMVNIYTVGLSQEYNKSYDSRVDLYIWCFWYIRSSKTFVNGACDNNDTQGNFF